MNNKKSKDKKHKSRFKDIFKSKFLTSFTKNLKTNNKLNSLKELYSSISNKLDDLAGFNDNENYKNANNKDIIINKKNLNKKNFNNKNLNNRDFSNRDFNNRNLNNRDFSNRDFNNRNLNNRDFSNRDFNNKSFDKKNFDNRDFGKENLNKKNFNNKDFIKKNPNNRDFNKKNFNKKINNNNIDSLANGSTKEEEKHEKYLKEFDKKFNKQFHDDFDDDAFYMGNMSRFEEENNYNNPYNDMVEKDRSIKSKKQEKFKLKDLPKINKDSIKSFKKSIIKDDETKALFGAAIFGLIIIVLLFSSYYFLFYQPFIGELDAAKTNKMNELNSLFKGPLSLDDSVLTLKSEIELSNSPEEVKAIDILRPATYSWRTYQTKQIDNKKDEFNRIMISYDYENSIDGSKNIIINVSEAKMFVIQNDGIVLSNIEFQKPDTVAVPILITRLQAGAGLVSVGSIVDIYTLSNNNFQNQTITP
ncbi:MAG: hypothetical protein FWE58_06065, partial [Methanobrevibacter sp.]|nr:hypothetical protein [Methanobrevibacter sp.]